MHETIMQSYLAFLAWISSIADKAPRALPIMQRMITNLQTDLTELYTAIYGRQSAMPRAANAVAGRNLSAEESRAESEVIQKINSASPRGAGENAPRALWDGSFLRSLFDLLVSNPQLLQFIMSLFMKSPAAT